MARALIVIDVQKEYFPGGKAPLFQAEETEARKKGNAVLILAKNRNGPTDDVPLRFIDHSMRFVEREPDEEPDSP